MTTARRTTTLTAACLLGLALTAPTTAATAAGETCRGEAATIVGTGDSITGTEGRDVIVTGSADMVDGLGGDDLICVAVSGNPRSNIIDVDAGPGDDLVDTTAVGGGYYVTTTLGGGADVFTGGRTSDTVFAGTGTYRDPGTDTDRDTIDTGTGSDSVRSGSTGAPNADVIRLGDGGDQLTLGSPDLTAGAVVDGGTGDDSLSLRTGDADVTIDMAAGTFTGSAGTSAFTGFTYTAVVAGSGTITYRGTPGDDTFAVHPSGGTPTLDVTTGAGDDHLTVEPAALTAASRIALGEGRDEVLAATMTGSLAIDLVTDVLSVDGTEISATGLEDAWLMAPTLEMRGDAGDNDLTWTGCDVRLRGGAGDDSLYWNYDYVFEEHEFRCVGEARMNGGDGRDRLRSSGGDDLLIGGRGHDTIEGRGGADRVRGGRGNDVLDGGAARDDVRGGRGHDVLTGGSDDDRLLGGPGRDRADGGQGRDRCVAEREKRCER